MVRKSHGFTLIEILITTLIIGLFSGLSLAGYHFFKEQRELDEATKKVVELFELAKKKAVAGEKPVCSIDFDGRYQINWTTSDYSLQTCCDISDVCSRQITRIQLPSGISFTAADNMIFKPFGLGVLVAKTASLKSDAVSATTIITIDQNGNIDY